MLLLSHVLQAWDTPAFSETLKAEIEQLDVDTLPLQQGLLHSSYASAENTKAVIISFSETSGVIQVKAGVFYSGVIPGCNCADDPSPLEQYPEYCELQFDINMQTAETAVRLLSE
jgi:hypothetical protein